jgi:glyoxylase-like metal-dependent hydrolase (beta-lactamase superfamily II)
MGVSEKTSEDFMKEIGPHIYIETGYAGVTLGVIQSARGSIFIDSPFHPDDVRSWRASVLALGGVGERMMINLDTHMDRTLGGSAMESTVIAHQEALEEFRNRPVTFKPQAGDSGADWENKEGVLSTRWAIPEITFTDEMEIHWDKGELVLSHHPGPMNSAIWVTVPGEKVVFVGDALVTDQPPFLANADIPRWVEDLKQLLKPNYRNFLIVSGRSDLVPYELIRSQIHFLEKIDRRLGAMASRYAPPEDTQKLVPKLLAEFEFPEKFRTLYHKRLSNGLIKNYIHRYSKIKIETDNKDLDQTKHAE